jgi:hypothetical protein
LIAALLSGAAPAERLAGLSCMWHIAPKVLKVCFSDV